MPLVRREQQVWPQGYEGNKLNERRAKEKAPIIPETTKRTDEQMNDSKTKMRTNDKRSEATN